MRDPAELAVRQQDLMAFKSMLPGPGTRWGGFAAGQGTLPAGAGTPAATSAPVGEGDRRKLNLHRMVGSAGLDKAVCR